MHRSSSLGSSDAEDHRLIGIASTHGLLKFLLD
jgi:hypothetical protein